MNTKSHNSERAMTSDFSSRRNFLTKDFQAQHPDLPLPPEGSETREQKFEVGFSDGRITYFRAPPSMKAEDWQKIRKLLDVLEPSNAEEQGF